MLFLTLVEEYIGILNFDTFAWSKKLVEWTTTETVIAFLVRKTGLICLVLVGLTCRQTVKLASRQTGKQNMVGFQKFLKIVCRLNYLDFYFI